MSEETKGGNACNDGDSTDDERNEFDYVIVGAGPSAMGLLYGILTSYYDTEKMETKDLVSDKKKPMLSIAVIERGNDGNGVAAVSSSAGANSTPMASNNQNNERESASEISSFSSMSKYFISKPSHWYKAAHDKHDNVTHHPMLLKGNRRTDLPIGKGLGGTSIVNACLCMSPLISAFPAPGQRQSKDRTDHNHDQTMVDNDFELWPEPWKTHLVNDWIPYIQNTIESNGHLYYYDKGIKSSIPYHYEYYGRNDIFGKDTETETQSEQPSVLQIDPRGTPNLMQQQVQQRKGSFYVRSTYYNALLEPFLTKHPSIAKSVTWFCGVQVERLLCEAATATTKTTQPNTATMIHGNSNDNGDDTSSRRIVVGVEVSTSRHCSSSNQQYSTGNRHSKEHFKIFARQDVILCAGAIESPALLLLDQLEMKRCYDQKDSKPSQKAQIDSLQDEEVFVLSGVGRHLKDQVLLPHAYLNPPFVWGMRSKSTSSPNGIAFLGYLRTKCNENGIDDSQKDRKGELFQVAVTDSTGQSFTMPALAAMALRRRYEGGGLHHDKWRLGLAYILEGLFVVAKTSLYIALTYTPLGWFLRYSTTTTLLILLFPQSSGSVQIRPVTQDRTEKVAGVSSSTEKMNTAVKDKHKKLEPWSELTERSEQKQEDPWRRCMVELDIDVGYLRDDIDLQCLKRGWDACTHLVRPNFLSFFPPCLPRVAKDWWWKLYCCSFSLPYYHFMGTCSMKLSTRRMLSEESHEVDNVNAEPIDINNDDWVVHSNLLVRNYSGLRICDASVVPTMISAPPALTLTAIGYGLGQAIGQKAL